MSSFCSLKCFLISILCYIRGVRTEVPEYCLQPLNHSDCGKTPTAVLTYWKPGSRCEVDVWRGCPTYNKFEDEYNCSATCIFKVNLAEPLDDGDECQETLNEKKCTEIVQRVYTYEYGVCVPKTWRGCPSFNKFINKTVCKKACDKDKWQDNLEEMQVEQLKLMVNLIDNVIKDTTAEAVYETSIESVTTGISNVVTTEEEESNAGPASKEQETLEQDTSEHSTTEHSATDNSATEHSATDSSTTEQSTTEHNTTEQVAEETNTTIANNEDSEPDSDEIDVVTTY